MSNSSLFKDKTTVELGCGAALSSIAVGKLVGAGGGATSSVVIATDNNPEVLNLAKRNIERNDLSGVVTTAMLQWGSMAAVDYENFADVIIGSDLTYNSGSWVALAETMSIILKPEGIVIYLVSVDFLLKRASSVVFRLMIGHRSSSIVGRDEDTGSFRIQRGRRVGGIPLGGGKFRLAAFDDELWDAESLH